ncbi:MAG: hypothetical protein QXH80_02705 [Candidatus Nanoarchaeia archaeon]
MIYIQLTNEFNEGKLRAVICSGQAAVLHRIAIMSKDGDWIIKEDEETTQHILKTLAKYNARYRFGAPLDIRWLKNGWSSHFEFFHNKIRIRTDFFTRPPRISANMLERLWKDAENRHPPFTDKRILAEMKKTNREKDYVVIGELARKMESIEDMFLYSRSARDILKLASSYPQILDKVKSQREILAKLPCSLEKLEEELDAEKRRLIHENEERLAKFANASKNWADKWPKVLPLIENLPLFDAHKIVCKEAENVLPFKP